MIGEVESYTTGWYNRNVARVNGQNFPGRLKTWEMYGVKNKQENRRAKDTKISSDKKYLMRR